MLLLAKGLLLGSLLPLLPFLSQGYRWNRLFNTYLKIPDSVAPFKLSHVQALAHLGQEASLVASFPTEITLASHKQCRKLFETGEDSLVLLPQATTLHPECGFQLQLRMKQGCALYNTREGDSHLLKSQKHYVFIGRVVESSLEVDFVLGENVQLFLKSYECELDRLKRSRNQYLFVALGLLGLSALALLTKLD